MDSAELVVIVNGIGTVPHRVQLVQPVLLKGIRLLTRGLELAVEVLPIAEDALSVRPAFDAL
jgi:hypothetical protein